MKDDSTHMPCILAPTTFSCILNAVVATVSRAIGYSLRSYYLMRLQLNHGVGLHSTDWRARQEVITM